jgi:phage tail sheath protein FI
MPEYLAPGVYIEEVSFRNKTIEGVSTSTAGFVGPTRYGPERGEATFVTSYGEFERYFGGLDPLTWGGREVTNYLAHAVQSFFYEGGRRLWVSRVFRPRAGSAGVAQATIGSGLSLRARYPGSGGNLEVTITARLGQNILTGEPVDPTDLTGPRAPVVRGLRRWDVVWIGPETAGGGLALSPPSLAAGELYAAEPITDPSTGASTWRFLPESGTARLQADLDPDTEVVRVLGVSVQVAFPSRRIRRVDVWENLGLHAEHENSLLRVFAATPPARQQELEVPLIVDAGGLTNAAALARVLLVHPRPPLERVRLIRRLRTLGLVDLDDDDAFTDLSVLALLPYDAVGDAFLRVTFLMTQGNDGDRPEAADYAGVESDVPAEQSGLRVFEAVADISIAAAPGHSLEGGAGRPYEANTRQIMRHLIGHCERMRYRIAVLDAADGQSMSDVMRFRGQVDSTHAALYYPWVRVLDPVTEREIHLPPSGFVAGIYARNDVDKGVHKAPANEVIRQAIGLEALLNKAQQDVLNPLGINALRFFEGRGYRVWGARTISSDPEWKYVNLRRFFAYLERSIEIGTQWAVFENNGPLLWGNVRSTVEDFLYNEWRSGRLLGEKEEEAFFVRCDRSTMTQNDLDNGRLICLVGVAPLKPAEFVIFRIGQWTADRRA